MKKHSLAVLLLGVFFPPLAFLYLERLGLAVLSFVVLTILWCLDIFYRDFFSETILQDLTIFTLIGSLLFLLLAIYLSIVYCRNDSPKYYAQWQGIVVILFSGFALFAVINSFFYGLYKIPSESMQPNYDVGDYVLVEKYPYGSYRVFGYSIYQRNFIDRKQPKHGDVFVFYSPASQQYYIKRIIALPNDKLAISGASILINSRLVNRQLQQDEHYLETLNDQQYLVKYTTNQVVNRGGQSLSLQIPAKHYFVMGDNRNNSFDSRFIGVINADVLVGKVIARF